MYCVFSLDVLVHQMPIICQYCTSVHEKYDLLRRLPRLCNIVLPDHRTVGEVQKGTEEAFAV